MRKFLTSLLIIIFITLLQLSIYVLFLKPKITTWGATPAEISMPMVGDDKALTITSTRAITIHASPANVWRWLIQLGADRGGFYSYSFIEEALGYVTRYQATPKTEFNTLAVGDVVRGSIDEKRSLIPYNFPVLYVEPEKTFVLQNWGTFLLQPITSHQTRLIIRTQEIPRSSPCGKIANYVSIPFHFIMERRTLMGMKAQVEAGENVRLSQSADIIWFLVIVLTSLLIYTVIFIGRGVTQRIIMPTAFALCWLFTLLLFNPTPLYSIGLLSLVAAYMLHAVRFLAFIKKKAY